MLEIHKLRWKAVGRFVEEQEIDFTKLGSLAQLDGTRLDTGGSSGSGKSTVFNCLDYAFGLNDSLPSTVLQSRYTDEPISVTVIGKYIGEDLTIMRGKGKLSVQLGEKKIGGSKLCEEKIDEILGMPRKLFRPLLHKRQKEGGFFLQFSPGQIHEFLTDCLGLSEIRKKQELADAKIKKLEEDLTFNKNFLQSSKAALEATLNAAGALGSAPERDIDQSVVLAQKSLYEASLKALEPVKARHTLELGAYQLTKPELKSRDADNTALKNAEATLTFIEAEQRAIQAKQAQIQQEERDRANRYASTIQAHKVSLSSLKYDVQTATKVKSEAAIVALEIKKIRESLCPTCEQGWATDAAKKREVELLEKINNYKELIIKGAKAEAEIAKLTAEIEQLTPLAVEKRLDLLPEHATLEFKNKAIRDVIMAERARLQEYSNAQHEINKNLLTEYLFGHEAIVQRHANELQLIQGQIDVTFRAFQASAQKYKAYEEARARYETSVQKIQEQKVNGDKNVAHYQKEVDKLAADLLLAEECKKAIKGYTSCSFDEALDYIGAQATDIIRAIPNMANATIQLEGIRETQAGKVKEEVNAVINMDGEVSIPIKSLSGGERSSVDLAVDLAVIDLLETRTNKGINLFILDEPFTGLDTVSIEMAIEKLKSLNKRLIIVDHNPEIKQMVESRLLVVRDGLTSKIVQN